MKPTNATIILVFAAMPVNSAYAYLDPGTASLLLQGLIGGVAAVIASYKLFYAKVKDRILHLSRSSKGSPK